MPLIVQKYGGTSVGTPERIIAVAQRIALARQQGHQLVVVVSAMGQSTDELIELAHRVSQDPPHREMDMLLTAGERISMALLSMALADLKIRAMSFTGSQSGIITTSSHRRARIRRILGDRVRAALADDQVAIVAGFQGVSESKEITTLGRGGSDTTAVALAAALGADRPRGEALAHDPACAHGGARDQGRRRASSQERGARQAVQGAASGAQ
jgi:aspartate kinase